MNGRSFLAAILLAGGLRHVQGKQIRLRFTLQNARLYSFRVADAIVAVFRRHYKLVKKLTDVC
jgi:hypothetical protein